MPEFGFQKTIAWYDQNAEQYANATENTPSIDELDEFAALVPHGSKVLDAGCGAGRDTRLLKERGLSAIGLDLSHGLIEEAKKRCPECQFVEGSFLELPFQNGEFNGVWAHASLVHLETEDQVGQALGEFNRVLKDGGILHVLVKAQTGNTKTAVVSDTLSKHDRFFQYFTEDEMRTLLKKYGFQIVRLEQYKETDRSPSGRPEVEWILVLGRKLSS